MHDDELEIRRKFGLPEVPPTMEGPPVDYEAVRRFLSGKSGRWETEGVAGHIHDFVNWYRAAVEVMGFLPQEA